MFLNQQQLGWLTKNKKLRNFSEAKNGEMEKQQNKTKPIPIGNSIISWGLGAFFLSTTKKEQMNEFFKNLLKTTKKYKPQVASKSNTRK